MFTLFARLPRLRPSLAVCAATLTLLAPLVSRAAEPLLPGDSNDPRMGDYAGTFELPGWAPTPATARVVGKGGGNYIVQLHAQAPAEAKTENVQAFPPIALELTGSVTGTSVTVQGMQAGLAWIGGIQENGELCLAAVNPYGGKFRLKPTVRKSPTLGQQPPAGAVVLIPYAEGALTNMDAWNNKAWQPQPDGSVLVTKGDSNTLQEFGDVQVHLEFLSPYMPEASGQGRGNSGIFLQARYECQVLDSYGVLPLMGDVGSIYNQAAPPVNAALPPGTWQTYDIDFRAPRFASDGSVKELPRITVRLNGVLLHENRELPHATAGPKPPTAKGPIVLQDHHNPVRFRNMWVVEK